MPQIPNDLLNKPFRYFIRRNKGLYAAGLVSLFFTNLLDALPPLLIGQAIDQVSKGKPLNDTMLTIGKLVALITLLALFRFAWRIFWGRFSHNAATELRNLLYEKLLELGPGTLQKRTVGDLMALMANDINVFRMGIGPGQLVIFDVLIILMIVPPLMLSLSVPWTLQTLIFMPLVPFIVRKIMKSLNLGYAETQRTFAELSGKAAEIIAGIRVIKGYAQEEIQTNHYNQHSQEYESAMNRVARIDSFFAPSLELAMAAGCVILLIVGLPDLMAGTVTLGAYFAFYQYVRRMVWPMEGIGLGLANIQQARASFARLREVLAQESDLPDTGDQSVEAFRSLKFDKVSFCYPDASQEALKNVSFTLAAGEILGVTGVTGSGKTTLVNLLCRHFAPSAGEIFLNGLPIEQITRASLRQLVSIVPQETFVFSRKVTENMALGLDEWELEQLEETARVVELDDEIRSLTDGYETYLGERGVNLSGGQRQRLSLARALVRGSPLVVFDDALSAVDSRTEAAILKNLKRHIKEGEQRPSAILISHRIGSLKWCDRILVLNQSEVESIGSHEELLRNSPTYAKLYQLQSQKESRVELL